MVTLKQNVTKQMVNVENVYQRRMDLYQIWSYGKRVRQFEKETLTQVIEARAKATSVNINAQNLIPPPFKSFSSTGRFNFCFIPTNGCCGKIPWSESQPKLSGITGTSWKELKTGLPVDGAF